MNFISLWLITNSALSFSRRTGVSSILGFELTALDRTYIKVYPTTFVVT